MFKLANQTPRKRFGIVLGDRLNATMESVGCVCEIRQYVPLAARRRILVDAQATGRFRVHKILLDKPFVTVRRNLKHAHCSCHEEPCMHPK